MPPGTGSRKVPVSHVVDQGDVALVINSNMANLLSEAQHLTQSDQIRAANSTAFANLATVNYLLAGMQRNSGAAWTTLRASMGLPDLEVESDSDDETDTDEEKEAETIRDLMECIGTRFVPFGICAGSEKQGGQNETGMAPVQAAANHVTTLTVDGQNVDLVNLWSALNFSAGDQLIFRLEKLKTCNYTLNHYYKGTVSQHFNVEKECFQLVPDVFNMSSTPEGKLDFRIIGYWRIAQMMIQRKCCRQFNNIQVATSDTHNMQSGGAPQLFQVLFAPVFVSAWEPQYGASGFTGKRK